MKPSKQYQHKIPRVYLKRFGYEDGNNKWWVTVIKNDDIKPQKKSIKSFTAEENIFDIRSEDDLVVRMFEDYNSQLDNTYNKIISDLDKEKKLSPKSLGHLISLIPNLMCRSDYWRETIMQLISHENKINFLQIIIGHHCKNQNDFNNLNESTHFKILSESTPENALNRVLLYFIDHLLLRLKEYEVVIIQSQVNKPWSTSTNPIVVHNRTHQFEIFSKESEVYFPLTPKYLVYLHYKGSKDKKNILREYKSNHIYIATNELNEKLMKIILNNPSDYLILGE
ncbi:MAG: DUF4238 domain-containing protein [Bacteroidia bacterium]|nr:DUF4238 domain-containing protein [Bacteroidia bacterium]